MADPTRRETPGLPGTAAGTALFAGCTAPGGPGGSATASEAPATDAPTTGTAPTATAARTAGEGTPTGTTTARTPRDVRFESRAGTRVAGTLYGSGDCGVVFVPQINLDRGSWATQARAVADRGHAALAIDEDPDGRAASALGAAGYLRDTVGVSSLVFVGASSGGEAVVRATARAGDGSVDGLVALSAGGGVDVAGRLQGRKLFGGGENGDDRFVRTARRLHERAPDPKRLQVYDGSAHGQGIFETGRGEDLTARLFDVIESACGSSTE